MTRTLLRPALLLLLTVTACATPRGSVQPLAGGVPAVRPCPDWSRASREDFSNRTTSNFGCADAVNFHAQLVEAGDAVRGRGNAPGDAAGAAAAIGRQRLAPPATVATGPATATGKAEPRP